MADGPLEEMVHFNGRFALFIDGLNIGCWRECSGLSVQVDFEEVKEGGQNQFTHKLPGRMKWPNLVFKRGVTNTNALFQWFRSTSGDGFAGEGGKLTRHTGQVVLIAANGIPVRAWAFEGAFPVKWTGPSLAAASRDVAGEELEIAHNGFISA